VVKLVNYTTNARDVVGGERTAFPRFRSSSASKARKKMTHKASALLFLVFPYFGSFQGFFFQNSKATCLNSLPNGFFVLFFSG